jgi:hypothetical protein
VFLRMDVVLRVVEEVRERRFVLGTVLQIIS